MAPMAGSRVYPRSLPTTRHEDMTHWSQQPLGVITYLGVMAGEKTERVVGIRVEGRERREQDLLVRKHHLLMLLLLLRRHRLAVGSCRT